MAYLNPDTSSVAVSKELKNPIPQIVYENSDMVKQIINRVDQLEERLQSVATPRLNIENKAAGDKVEESSSELFCQIKYNNSSLVILIGRLDDLLNRLEL